MQSTIFSATVIGVRAQQLSVEVDVTLGLINFYIVGLPDAAIKESRQRIQTALKNCGIKLPDRKITVNLAPADLKKEGTMLDLPIAIGILRALNLIQAPAHIFEETLFLGELSLDGSVRPVKGALVIAHDAVNQFGKKRLILPLHNAPEAALINELEVIGISHLTDVVAYICGNKSITPTKTTWHPHPSNTALLDFAHIKGQRQAKRALQIAAAGKHNLLFMGSPGSGKTMLAQCLASIMPPLSFEEAVQTSALYSVCGKLPNQNVISQRPFRAPHHSISQAGLIGGGSTPQPGEVSLAHNGVLFLDELAEFKRHSLQALRQPLEEHTVNIARAQHTTHFPASFILIAALNPCPCGFYGDKQRTCVCSPQAIRTYLQKLSGPLLDRIDLQIYVPSLAYEVMKDTRTHTSSAELYQPVEQAIAIQKKRFNSTRFNNAMLAHEIEKFCPLKPEAETLVKQAFERLRLSMRGYHKLLKIARTIADLAQSESIEAIHVQEAITYRSLDTALINPESC